MNGDYALSLRQVVKLCGSDRCCDRYPPTSGVLWRVTFACTLSAEYRRTKSAVLFESELQRTIRVTQ